MNLLAVIILFLALIVPSYLVPPTLIGNGIIKGALPITVPGKGVFIPKKLDIQPLVSLNPRPQPGNKDRLVANAYNPLSLAEDISVFFQSVSSGIKGSLDSAVQALMDKKPSSSTDTEEESPEECQCGIEGISTRIISGKKVIPGKYPWFVPLIECGAAFITDRHLLTSAHCLFPEEDRFMIRIVLELSQFQYSSSELYSLPGLPIEEFIIHDDYKTSYNKERQDWKFFNDIAIIKLQHPVEFKNGFNPICLPDFTEIDNLFVYGLGLQDRHGRLVEPQYMHETQVTAISDQECQDYFDKTDYPAIFNKTLTLCTRDIDSLAGPCNGDSGGPLSTRKYGRVYQMGTNTFSHPTCNIMTDINTVVSPSGYERISEHLPWIRKNTLDGKYCRGEHQAFKEQIL